MKLADSLYRAMRNRSPSAFEASPAKQTSAAHTGEKAGVSEEKVAVRGVKAGIDTPHLPKPTGGNSVSQPNKTTAARMSESVRSLGALATTQRKEPIPSPSDPEELV